MNYLKPTAHGWKISKRQAPRPGNAAAGQNQAAINLQNENLLGGPPARADQRPGPINRLNLPEKSPTNAQHPPIRRLTVRPAGRGGASQMMTGGPRHMRSRTAANNPAKEASQMLAKMQHLPPKICSANARNLPAGPALLIAPHRKVPAKKQAPIPQVGRKNPAQAKPAGIFLASQQNRIAAILQQGRRTMHHMLENALRNRDKQAQNRQGWARPNQECPNRAHHG